MAQIETMGTLPIHQKGPSRELRHGRTAHNVSTSSLRKKSDVAILANVRWAPLRNLLANIQEVFLGTKLFVLFPAVPAAAVAHIYHYGSGWLFALSLLGLTPLAERVSFLTEQIAFYTGPTVGGLLNATCGNATELIIALFALQQGKVDVVKRSLLGSILSNLLLVLGSSLFVGGISNLTRFKEQTFDRRQVDVAMGLLLLGLLCHMLPLLLHYAPVPEASALSHPSLTFSRACGIIMLVAYSVYIFFQLKTHSQMFEDKKEEEDEYDDELSEDEKPVIGLASAIMWLIAMTVVIAVLSDYVVGTIEQASQFWGLPISFVSIILLPIVGNAAEHAGAVIFACKNKLDITMGVSLGSAAQISVFVVPLSVIVAWIMGIPMDLDFNVLETASLALTIFLASNALRDGTSHYLKGLVLLLAYIAIGTCFFVLRTPLGTGNVVHLGDHMGLGATPA